MTKIMLFIDGTWLYCNTPRLSDVYGQPDFRVHFGKLPNVLAEEVSRQMGGIQVDLVRTHLYGSYATNHDARDDDAVQRRRDFFELLKEEYNYEVETFPINFMGRPLRRADRDPSDPFEPKEKCVDIALASSALYYSAIPSAYDIAVAVVGDQDFRPMLRTLRRLGKRVAIASTKGSCSPALADPRDEAGVKDFDTIWLDDLLQRLELTYERHLLTCEAPGHDGDSEVWTTFYPRKGQKFFCDDCRREFSRSHKREQGLVTTMHTRVPSGSEDGVVDREMVGVIRRKIADRGYGFIESSEGRSYFFHLSDLQPQLGFEQVEEGQQVQFRVKREPSETQAGAAQAVRELVAD